MKITFKCKIIADVSADPQFSKYKGTALADEPTLVWIQQLIKDNKCTFEMVPSLGPDNEPSLLITEKTET